MARSGSKWDQEERRGKQMSRLIGGYTHKVDQKGRFSIPASIYEGIASSAEGVFILIPGLDGCLEMYPLNEWIKRANFLRRVPHTLGKAYKRKVLSQATLCKIDQHRRILVPPDVLKRVGIEDEVFILGQLDHIELWNPKAFEKFIEENDVSLEDIYKQIEDYIYRSEPEGRP